MSEGHRTSRVRGVISNLALFGSFAIFALLAVAPCFGTYQTLTVLTNSMRPGLPAGTMVIATPTSSLNVRRGDIIVYQAPIDDHRVVMHRVVGAWQRDRAVLIQTKGDANASPDPWLARITGGTVWKIRAAVPFAGSVIVALRSPTAHRLLVFVLPFLFAVIWLRDIWSADKREAGATA